ncbi:hypothetical protein UNSW1_1794 [Campylobacter concisus UNSW1]|nr:hypothetical protein UNSW1_1794 [Campylobacter concisus UNSW1]
MKFGAFCSYFCKEILKRLNKKINFIPSCDKIYAQKSKNFLDKFTKIDEKFGCRVNLYIFKYNHALAR